MFSIRGGKIVQLLQLKQLDRRYDNSLVRPRYLSQIQIKFPLKLFLKIKIKKEKNLFIFNTAPHLNNELK